MFFLNAPSKFLVQCFHDLDSKDLGLWDLGMNNDRAADDASSLLPKRCAARCPGSGATPFANRCR